MQSLNINQIRNAYELICNRENINETLNERINVLQYLERVLGLDFKNTEDFHEKMQEVFIQQSGAIELKRVRDEKGWSQSRLANHLGTSQPFIVAMELGKRGLIKKALRFIEYNQNQGM